jgi:hypothetical protein
VQLEWTASTDNVGVDHYDVFRDGARIGTAPSPLFLDPTASVSVGQHAYVVFAEDAAGNHSAGSNPKVVMVPAKDRRPILRWYRRLHGTIVLEVDARMASDVTRISLSLNGRLLRSKAGRWFRFTWRQRRLQCGQRYRFVARTYDHKGAELTASSVVLPGRCR